MNTEPPQITRTSIGHRITQIDSATGTSARKITLHVQYEEGNKLYSASFRKCVGGGWREIPRSQTAGQRVYNRRSRTSVLCGELVTVSPSLHYFCFIEVLQSGLSCRNVDDIVCNDSSKIIRLPNTTISILPSSSTICDMSLSGNYLLVTVDTQGERSIFDMLTLENVLGT